MGKETTLDYDSIIWQVFSVGVVASVTILYYFLKGDLPKGWESYGLLLGFSILVYSFFLVLGYGFKKCQPNGSEVKLNACYPRVRWMGEAILIMIGIFYWMSFPEKCLPIITLLIGGILCCFANIIALKKFINKANNEKDNENEWKSCWLYLKRYFLE